MGRVNYLTVIVWFLLSSFLLFGCSSSNEEITTDEKGSTEGEASNEEMTEIRLLMGEADDTEGFRAVMEAMEEDIGIKTKIELRPGGPEGENIVKTRLATGEMSDILLFNSGSLLMALNPEKYFVDLSDEPFVDKIMDSYKEVVSEEGKIYGIPEGSSQVGGWLYNKRVYEELDLEVPKTWDELMENNEKIKEAGKVPVIGTHGEIWTSQLPILADFYNVQAEVPNFAEEYTAGKAKFSNTPEAQRGFERIQELYERGFMNEDYTVAEYGQGRQMLAEGEGVHYPMLTQVLENINEDFPELVNDIGIFPQPSDDPSINGFTVWMPNAYLINKDSEKVETAKKWMDYFLSDKAIKLYEENSKSIGPYVIEGVELPEDSYTAVKDVVPYFESGDVAPALEFVSPIKGPNLPQICTAVGTGQMTAEEAAEMYDDDVEKQAKQLGMEWD